MFKYLIKEYRIEVKIFEWNTVGFDVACGGGDIDLGNDIAQSRRICI
ncbi:hypothetical protein roselon_01353 [Roseibacterium elongatum DSM 19469]|uniref:Uncharacterized protein n=1 Tax=Roseicyclus elongatus DSM 19469 TaxID=1294273 RepID=W8S4K5_9RHOB|nr:hypothetical protein roselon_01353 [Roseibacterium elongatum DSM 19469]